MTQRGARKHFQQSLRSKGVEVVEFDFLTPDAVADYCYERGFLQVGVWYISVCNVCTALCISFSALFACTQVNVQIVSRQQFFYGSAF